MNRKRDARGRFMKEDKTNTTNKSEVILNEATDTNKDSTEKENIELEKNNDLTLNPNVLRIIYVRERI